MSTASYERSARTADLSLWSACVVLSINSYMKMIVFIYKLHENLLAKMHANEPAFTSVPRGNYSQDCKETCRPGQCVCVCVLICLHNSDLQHLFMDAVMSIGAEVGLVLVLAELRHTAQGAGPARFCIQHQPLSQHPERTSHRSPFNFSY